ncbi:lipoprotein signal peptidase [Aliiroseovarius zhejiangensis]|uniref:Lipoprotein signal peptidase n=1 Tax=Aliiroseovarius zhejiangensis TaxID=1632025 RepID=A0ABQ3J6W0_9RHOB|nr:signal peptidase II [Aliiroseovarius zhejiangensis]GHF07808.1 lipoprotein signal peptidase [Aliiroseovarius zhejiangensis]
MRALLIAAILAFALDQGTKYHALYVLDLDRVGVVQIWPPYLVYQMAWNTGVNFGLFGSDAATMRWVLVGLSAVISAWVIIWVRREKLGKLAHVAAGLLVGGALGNAVDRIYYGAVVDFLNMSCCGIQNPFSFNVADIFVFAGAIGLVLFSSAKKTP